MLFVLFACRKDRYGSVGGNATLVFYPTWKNPANNDAVTPAPVDVVYIWFDGTNSEGLNQPKNPSTANIEAHGNPAENYIKIKNLKWGKYGWRMFTKTPGMWKTHTAQGSSYVLWKNRNKETRVDVELH
jgi:hypothetical protein